jgi:hypothetical protein
VPTGAATLRAMLIGILIPVLSSIIPIFSAIEKELVRSLDTTRSKLDGNQITITEGDSVNKIAYLIFGFLCVVYGVSMYVLLPLALLTLDPSLLLGVFLFILLGMLLGLVIIASNF